MAFRTSTVEDIGVKLVTAGSGGSLREGEEREEERGGGRGERERERDLILVCTHTL